MAALVEAMACRGILATISRKNRYIIPNATTITKRHHSEAATNDERYDIIISGGGMVGTTLACALASNRKLEDRNILLLESARKQEYIPSEIYSNRVVSLNKQTRTLLSSIGAWQHIQAARFCGVKMIQVWDACSDAIITFNKDQLFEEIAYIVENDLLLYAVNKQLSKKENVNVLYDSKIETINLPKLQGEDAVVKLENGQTYRTKLLIGADGANSLVRQTMGVQYVKWGYNQMGIVATLKLSEPTENIVAWQRFLPTGPISFLPLTDSLSSLVWSLTTDEAKRLLKVSEEEFVDSVNDAIWKVYPKDGTVEVSMRALQQLLEGLSLPTGASRQLPPSVSGIVENSRAAFPLGFGHSVCYVHQGTALVGDAAHRVHPLAGQGVNLGFGDVITLVQILAEAAENGAFLGDITYLRKYETLRQRYNVLTMLTIDALHWLYKGTATPVVLARSLGLQLTNSLPPLKRALIQHASGISDDASIGILQQLLYQYSMINTSLSDAKVGNISCTSRGR